MNDPFKHDSLMEKIRGRDTSGPEAMRALVHALTPVIRLAVTRAMRRRSPARREVAQEVEDMVQSVLFAVFVKDGGRALLAWDPGRGLDLEGYVALLASREVDSVLRSRRRCPWTEEPAQDEAAFERSGVVRAGLETLTGSKRMLVAVATRLCARVSPRAFEMFDMLFVQERSPEDVAASEGLAVGAVYTWKSRLAQVAREIADELEAERRPAHRSASSRAQAR